MEKCLLSVFKRMPVALSEGNEYSVAYCQRHYQASCSAPCRSGSNERGARELCTFNVIKQPKEREMRPVRSLCLSAHLCVYKIWNQFVHFYEVQQEGHAIQGDLNTIIFNAVTATILERRTFRSPR
jgi:hypothetical protein